MPLAVFLLELPIAIVRGLFASERWIEAVTRYPQEITITWRIEDRERLQESFGRITGALSRGYEGLEFAGAQIVRMTPPAGLDDISP